jgi:hypothetical protein
LTKEFSINVTSLCFFTSSIKKLSKSIRLHTKPGAIFNDLKSGLNGTRRQLPLGA